MNKAECIKAPASQEWLAQCDKRISDLKRKADEILESKKKALEYAKNCQQEIRAIFWQIRTIENVK